MKKRVFNIIILLAFAALSGVVVMQVYWMRNAFLLKEEQYDNSVRIAMKSVLNRLLPLCGCYRRPIRVFFKKQRLVM